MFICEDCENIFTESKVILEHHPYGMGYASEEIYVCPHCNSTAIAEAVKCKRCGEYFVELPEDDICDLCYGEMYGD